MLASLLAAALAAAPAPRPLAVAAASSLKLAVEDLERAFEAERPGVDVTVALGGSGALYAQIANGAPFDVFLSADRDYPRRAVAEGLAAPPGEVVYAAGALVAWAPRGSPVDLGKGLAALADPAVRRVAVANPAIAPYGRAAEAALRAAGLWEAVRPKLVLGQNVSQAAQFAESGAADAALLPLALTFAPRLREGRVLPLPGVPRQEQSGVVLSRAREPELARAFLGFAAGAKGRAILAKYGYAPP
ncbi:MAG TPA: molybdate ABC transporter substrate-binding protein [Anaeromyxobacteraceae bacterium]|nr:molybdate ABC transporter substrate-binding protein [Anaeromyxobacteraceae bacterium]